VGTFRIYRRLQDLNDVDPNGLPDQGVPKYDTLVSSFVVETVGAGGAGFSLGASTLGNTLGDTGVTGTRVVLAGGNGITLSQATDANGGTITVSGATQAAQTVQTQDRFNLTLAGNTLGVLQEVSSGTLTLAGGNNITLSQNGNAITVVGAAGGAETQTGISGIVGSDATYTSGTVQFTGSNLVTVRSSAGQRIVIDASFSQSVQPETQTFLGGLAASNTTYTSGTVTLTGVGGGVTVSSNTGQRIDISVAAPVAQTGTQFTGGVSGGNTSGHSGTVAGRLLLAGGNNITLSGSTNGASMSVTISGPNTAAQSAESQSIGMSNIGNTSGTTGIASGAQVRFLLAGGNNVTLSQSLNGASGTLTISAANQTVQTQNMVAVTLSGNTSGAQALISSGTMTLAGGNNITVSQAGNAVTISGPNVGGAQTGISGLANSETTYTSGSVTFSALGAITIRSTTGQHFQFSVNSQTVQTQSLFSAGVSTGGNTAGDTGVTGTRLVFVGSNNITLSQATAAAGGTITISGPTTVAQTNQSGGAYAVGNTYSSSSGTFDARTLSIRGDGIISVAATNSGWRISASQSVQAETQTFVGGLAASNTTYTSGTITITGVGGGVTVSSNTGQRIDISVAAPVAQTNQSGGVYAVGNTYSSSSGTIDARTISIRGDGIISIAATNSGWRISASESVQTQNLHNVTLSGNTAGVMAQISSGTMTLAGGANITLSQAGNAVTISGGGGSASDSDVTAITQAAHGFSVGDWLRLSGTTYVLAQADSEANAEVVGVVSAVADVDNFTLTTGGLVTGLSGLTAGTVYYLSASSAGDITTTEPSAVGEVSKPVFIARSTTSGYVFNMRGAIVPAALTAFLAGMSNIGNTSGNTGITGSRLVLAGGNNITLSQSTNASGGTVTISAFNQTGTQFSAGLSNIGNTAGDTGTVAGRLVLAGGNNVTLSGSTNGVSQTITISGGAGGGFSAGLSNLGNTQGDTGVTGTRLVIVGSDNITISQATGAAGATISIKGQSPAGGAFSGGVSNLGNTAGATGISGTQMVLVGSGVMSLSQTTGANGATVSLLAPATSSLVGVGNITISTDGSTISIADSVTPLNFWDNMVPGASTTFQLSDAGFHVFPLNPANAGFPGYMSVSSVFFDMSGTVSTAASFTRSMSFGVYTLVNSTQLSRLYSASTSWGTNAANMNINDSMGGRRWVTLHSSQFDAAPNFHEGSDYYMAVWNRSSSGSQTFAFQGQLLPYATGVRSGFMSVGSATNTTLGQYPFLGVYSVSFSTAMPAALAASDINKSVATAISLPRIIFNNVGSNIL
jgi:hypothetical protein